MIVYDRLWKTMQQRGISQYRLLKEYGFSSGQLDRIRRGESITMYTLNSLCEILDCRVEDILEYRDDEKQVERINGG